MAEESWPDKQIERSGIDAGYAAEVQALTVLLFADSARAYSTELGNDGRLEYESEEAWDRRKEEAILKFLSRLEVARMVRQRLSTALNETGIN